jgi:hypothetical protein
MLTNPAPPRRHKCTAEAAEQVETQIMLCFTRVIPGKLDGSEGSILSPEKITDTADWAM